MWESHVGETTQISKKDNFWNPLKSRIEISARAFLVLFPLVISISSLLNSPRWGSTTILDDLYQNIFWGGTPQKNFWEFYPPPTIDALLHFYWQIFENFQNLEFYVRQFFRKNYRKFPEIFSTFSKSKKKNYYHCSQNSPKSLYLSKFGQIFP